MGQHREGKNDEGVGLIQPDLFNPSSHVGVHACGTCTRVTLLICYYSPRIRVQEFVVFSSLTIMDSEFKEDTGSVVDIQAE